MGMFGKKKLAPGLTVNRGELDSAHWQSQAAIAKKIKSIFKKLRGQITAYPNYRQAGTTPAQESPR